MVCAASHDINDAADDDMYYDPSVVSSPAIPGAVFLVPEELNDISLDWTTRHRVDTGIAAFFAFPEKVSSEE